MNITNSIFSVKVPPFIDVFTAQLKSGAASVSDSVLKVASPKFNLRCWCSRQVCLFPGAKCKIASK